MRGNTTHAVLLAIGATALVLGSLGGGLVTLVLIGCGVVGATRAAAPRATVPLVAGLVLAALLVNFWGLLPAALSPEGLRQESPFLFALPVRLGAGLYLLLLAATALVARREVGRGLALITVAFVVVGLLATVAHVGFEAVEREPTLGFERAGLGFVLDVTSTGLNLAGRALVAATWIALALPRSLPTIRAQSPALATVGAVGTALVAATLASAPTNAAHELEWGELLYLVTVMIGWILAAVGLVGLRKDLGRLAIAGVVLILLQVVCCPITGYGFEDVIEGRFDVLVYVPATLGLLGVAVAAAPPRDASMRWPRILVTGLAAVAAAAILLSVVGILVTTSDAIGLRIDDPFRPMARIAQPAARFALVIWAAVMALMASPPDSDEPAASGAEGLSSPAGGLAPGAEPPSGPVDFGHGS